MKPTKEQILERETLAKEGKKRCSERSGCGKILPLNDFGVDNGKWDKKRTICISCNRNRSNEYNKSNRKARREYRRQYYRDNIEAEREYHRIYMKNRRQGEATSGGI